MLASSKTRASPSTFKALDIPEHRPKEILFSQIDIITGMVSNKIIIIAMAPQELLIRPKLDEIVERESLTKPPTTGMKFPIANRAVLRDNESALRLKTL